MINQLLVRTMKVLFILVKAVLDNFCLYSMGFAAILGGITLLTAWDHEAYTAMQIYELWRSLADPAIVHIFILWILFFDVGRILFGIHPLPKILRDLIQVFASHRESHITFGPQWLRQEEDRRNDLPYSTGDVLDERVVEPLILDLVKSLNKPSLGVKTIASCQGHFFSELTPYVYFKAPTKIAAELAAKVQAKHRTEIKTLYLPWMIDPTYNTEFEVCYSLSTHFTRYEIPSGLSPLNARRWRQQVIEDFSELRELIEEVLKDVDENV